jgi:hypothetical protein
MRHKRDHDNTESYRMIWQFTIAPLMIAVGYFITVLLYLSYIGTTL